MKKTLQLPKCLTSYHLKVIAIISMLIDHFAYIPFASVLSEAYSVTDGTAAYTGVKQKFFLWVAEHESILWTFSDIMHWIGRLAFPLFCFLLVQGFIHTRSKAKYALRLAIFALISEIPYDMAFSGCILSLRNNNVFFTLLTGLLMIWGITGVPNRVENSLCIWQHIYYWMNIVCATVPGYGILYLDDERKRIITWADSLWYCRMFSFSSIVLFDGFRWYDVVINVVLIYILFFRKVKR